MFTSTVEAMVAEERSKSHHVFADRLQRAMQSVPVTASSELNKLQGTGRDFVVEAEPQVRLDDLILSLPAERVSNQLIEEHNRADMLRAQGMQPRHKVLLSGPPGNGKTSLAEAIAYGTSLPFLTVRYDALVGAYLGETNARLARLFEFARVTPCVLFFDEFDSIGKERGDVHETGEIKRVVSFLLMQLDRLPSYVIAIAATNHAELLDRAVWRRFQIRLEMPPPDAARRSVLIQRFFDVWQEPSGITAEDLANRLGNASFAEIFEFCQTVRRRHILSQGGMTIRGVIAEEIELWTARVAPGVGNEVGATTTGPTGSTEQRRSKKTRRRVSPAS
jgi:SpoVK/Ycf46/Vps4 family AAA+-type ATPase